MLVRKGGKVVDIPVKSGTIVKLREQRSGKVTDQKAVVVKSAPASNFSRAYGRQVYVCTIYKDGPAIWEKGAGDLYPVGRAKRVPAVCRAAMREYEKEYGKKR